VPEVAQLLNLPQSVEKTETYDLGEATVSITSLENLTPIPETTNEEESSDSESENGEKSMTNMNSNKKNLSYKTLVKKETNRLLQQSAVFKKSLKIKQKKSRKFRKHRIRGQEEKAEDLGRKSTKSCKVGAFKSKMGAKKK